MGLAALLGLRAPRSWIDRLVLVTVLLMLGIAVLYWIAGRARAAPRAPTVGMTVQQRS